MNTALHAYVKRPNGPTYTSRANPGSYRSSDVLVIGATPISARRTAHRIGHPKARTYVPGVDRPGKLASINAHVIFTSFKLTNRQVHELLAPLHDAPTAQPENFHPTGAPA